MEDFGDPVDADSIDFVFVAVCYRFLLQDLVLIPGSGGKGCQGHHRHDQERGDSKAHPSGQLADLVPEDRSEG